MVISIKVLFKSNQMKLTYYKDNRLDQKFTINISDAIQCYIDSKYYKNYGFQISVFGTFIGLEYGTYNLFTDNELNKIIKIYKSLKK